MTIKSPAQRLTAVQDRIIAACARVGRLVDEVQLVAVSKGHDVAAIKQLYDLGVRDFGESYVQEWEEKRDQLPEDIRWHFIGRLQSNKARFLVDKVHRIHSVDRLSVARKLDRRGQGRQAVLLQVNLGEEGTKGGVLLEAVAALRDAVDALEGVVVVGLMGIPPFFDDPEEARPLFADLREAAKSLGLRELSMGMTNDLEVAVEEGATMVRVGTALFGPRSYA